MEYTSCIKELEVKTFVIIISAFVVSEISSLVWDNNIGSTTPTPLRGHQNKGPFRNLDSCASSSTQYTCF